MVQISKINLANLQIDISFVKLTDSISKRNYLKLVEQKLKTKAMDQWKTKIKIKINCKLRTCTYNTFKTDFKLEKYLTETDNFKMKQSFARLKLSNHRLEIESGCYDNIKADLRYCKQCQNSDNQTYIEDEKHFLIVCPKFEKERKLFFDKLKMIILQI